MIYYFFIIVVLVFFLILLGIIIGLRLNRSKYFDKIIKDKSYEVEFFVKKHTLFRFFSIAYSIIHYSLNIISTTASFITVYMVIDSKTELSTQIFFLLTAAIASNLLLGLRMDRISETYAQAMRILENAILIFCLEEDSKKEILYEANEKAEQYIGNHFFNYFLYFLVL